MHWFKTGFYNTAGIQNQIWSIYKLNKKLNCDENVIRKQ